MLLDRWLIARLLVLALVVVWATGIVMEYLVYKLASYLRRGKR